MSLEQRARCPRATSAKKELSAALHQIWSEYVGELGEKPPLLEAYGVQAHSIPVTIYGSRFAPDDITDQIAQIGELNPQNLDGFSRERHVAYTPSFKRGTSVSHYQSLRKYEPHFRCLQDRDTNAIYVKPHRWLIADVTTINMFLTRQSKVIPTPLWSRLNNIPVAVHGEYELAWIIELLRAAAQLQYEIYAKIYENGPKIGSRTESWPQGLDYLITSSRRDVPLQGVQTVVETLSLLLSFRIEEYSIDDLFQLLLAHPRPMAELSQALQFGQLGMMVNSGLLSYPLHPLQVEGGKPILNPSWQSIFEQAQDPEVIRFIHQLATPGSRRFRGYTEADKEILGKGCPGIGLLQPILKRLAFLMKYNRSR